MKKINRFLLSLLLTASILIQFTFSQTPQYYNANSGGIGNSIPFGSLGTTGYRTQHMIGPNEYGTPSPAPAGNITKFYINCNTSGSPTVSQLTIKMGQTALTSLPSGGYMGTMTTVYSNASVTLNATANAWLLITLNTPFNYNPAQSLVIEIGHCGFTGTGFNVWQSAGTTGIFRRNNFPGSCPGAYSSQDSRILQSGIDIAPASTGPNYLHYKFENNPSSQSVINCATPGVGTQVATMTGLTLTAGGQFDSCITGAGVSGAGVVTGWNNNLGTSSWTISMWVDLPTTTFGYLFGDGGGSFRCFNNGAAGTNGITLRGTGISNVDLTGFGSGPVVVHFVYDSALANIKAYKNGVLAVTVAQTPLNLAAGTGFKVGGWTTVAGFTGKMDEFRLYRRALDSTEITATWNQDVACGILLPIINVNNEVPQSFSLAQNYPNPFNPVTSIRFAMPKSDFVTLKIFDALGREVEVLVNEQVNAGTHEIKFDASRLSSGIYFYTLESGSFKDAKKMMLIK